MTFSAAHKYLGLTTEVLRTEKAINEIACHPLPASFYEGGGLQYLRQRFDDIAVSDTNSENGISCLQSPTAVSASRLRRNASLTPSKDNIINRPKLMRSMTNRVISSYHQVQAGDLHTSAGQGTVDSFKPLTRSFSILSAPMLSARKDDSLCRLSGDEFDLREGVMSCIAKSIGLLQPPIVEGESGEASPGLPPLDPVRSASGTFASPFGSLSLLDSGDDGTSSATGASSSNATGYMSGLDNEVEILFFSAGSTLVKAGERNTGQNLLVLSPRETNVFSKVFIIS